MKTILPGGDRMTTTTYCYVTGEQCRSLKTADLDDEIDGMPVAAHGDYMPWTLDEHETNRLVYTATGYRFHAARAVQAEMCWSAIWAPIYEDLLVELRKLVGADAEMIRRGASDTMDEEEIARRGGFTAAGIAAAILDAWGDDREVEA